jgi:hypothetical protein
MIKAEQIKPIPKYMLKRIEKADADKRKKYDGHTRYYAYFTKLGGELAKVTVACKNRGKKWFCKQVAVHGIHSEDCLVKDFACFIICGYVVGWSEQGLTQYSKWWETHKWELAYDQYFNVYAPFLNKEYLNKFPEYKYSAIMQYPYLDVFKYLRLYEQYPQAEMLVKLGLSQYATSKQILKKVGKDKNFCKWLAQHRQAMIGKSFYIGTLLRAYKTKNSLEVTQLAIENKKLMGMISAATNIKRMFKTDTQRLELLEYLGKQNTPLSSYSDYLDACHYLGLDMSLPKNRFPHNFKHWHDMRTDQYNTAKALKDAEKRKELYAKFATVAEKYMSLQRDKNEGYIVVIARTPYELIQEGEALSHCVGRMNYDQKFAREESLIFFVRDKQSPDVPFVTVEYSLEHKKVLQCYGEHDHKPNESVLQFVNNKWLPYANRKLKQIAA